MHEICLIKCIIMILIKLTCAEHQDHIIYWDASHPRFKGNHNEIYVNDGDNLIFICSQNLANVQNLYWTKDPRVQMKCNKTLQIKVIQLLDCFSKKSLNEFTLKVSRFPEITSLPSFDYNIPVHFIAHSVICQKNNFRLSFKLKSNSMNDNVSNSSTFNVLMWSTSKSQLMDHNNESVLNLNESKLLYHLKSHIVPHTSTICLNHTLTSAKHVNWKEYEFLLLPAIFAFLTLIGMQIILCSFWLPNSIVIKFTKCFEKCKGSYKIQPNHTYHKDEIEDFQCENCHFINA
ncbi:hypothetical protein EWB00_009928 [Schistosoma japonicum]|uniref:Ephrin RBD domain-containing protein n=1 Tax=Schistosoma japonicum TaxID=6182 RepID=A0A4Z2CL13_SCHJA|nr:hypothetical protein KSF78_0001646 [Schistosoma japonicum]TNN04983.1 hypothetical protein EWB00_009928 [Schistosoma japonicum]